MYKLIAIIACLLSFGARASEPQITDSLPLYDDTVYASGFKHFSFVNPQAPKGGRVVLPAYGSFDNFNPYIFKGIAATQHALLSLDSLGVVPPDDVSTVYPLLAEKFERPSDNSYIGFILNPQARFSDGSPVTADDVIFTYNALIKDGSPFYKVYYGDVDYVKKINPHHVRFYFKPDTHNKELPLILSQLKIFSAQDWQGRDFSKPELRVPLGSGPYVLSKFSPNKYLVFERNPDYWAKDLPSRRGFFNFDEVRYDYYQDTTVTLQALFAGSIDAREEYIAKIWVTGYDNDIVKSGRVVKENLEHNQPANLQYFGFNTRLPQFADRRVREAIGLAFNFEWADENLFYKQYRRLPSAFTNTGMEASGLPQGKELKLLTPFRSQLPEAVFTQAPQLPRHDDYMATRRNLRQAVKLLQQAGYDFQDGVMTNLADGKPLEFEILSNSANGAAFTRVMLPFMANLRKIGIKTTFRNLETNIFKNRLDDFDFEMAILAVGVSSLVGNEQKELWGSQAADVKGSYNYMGIKNPAVDYLTQALVSAHHKDDYQAAVRALDRVLLQEHYFIPQWYSPYQRVAYWRKLHHPQTKVKAGFDIFTWWIE